MPDVKTKPTNHDPVDFLKTVKPEQKRLDSFKLLEIFERVTGEKAVMWGQSIVGFGLYHYRSKRSSQENNWPLAGFSPRKQYLTLYIMEGNKDSASMFGKLGKHKTSKACLYINKLSDVDLNILTKLIEKSFKYAQKTLTT